MCVTSNLLGFPEGERGSRPDEGLLAVLKMSFQVLALVVRDSHENQESVQRDGYYTLLRDSLQSARLLRSEYVATLLVVTHQRRTRSMVVIVIPVV